MNSATKTITVGFNNPHNRSITISAAITDPETGSYSTGNSTNGSLSLNSDSIYATMPSKTSRTLRITVSATGLSATKDITVSADKSYCGPSVKTAGFV